ncbi:GNAT family N-acetyltransferase [Streptococcus canis]|uniref:GNAT family N-acetyltransferase n=1 Tax=Streptococcus canis TaxID=1329 RepID=UPI0013DA86D6|nr:GNAT family N-acetyltransferase [Streptococcus canis]QKG78415.1 GNAT family N-acetyltransferase [Streptococcus canis]
MTKLRQLTVFKGSNFLIPMFLTSIIYTFYPHLLNLGDPFSGLFSQDTTFFIIAVLLIVSGIQTNLGKYPKVIKAIGPVLLLKIGIALLITLAWKAFFPASGFLGITAVTITAILMSLNLGMYLVLLDKDISEMEESAFSVINLVMLPAIPLLILSVGESNINLITPLLANILPFAIGVLIGYLYPSSRAMSRPLSMLLIPFLAVTFGARINIITALQSSLTGLLLVVLYYALAVLPVALFDKEWNKKEGRMTLSMSSIAAFSMSIPPFVSQYLPLSETVMAQSISQIAFAVIISSFTTPYLYKKLIKTTSREENVEKVYQLSRDSHKPEFLLEAMAAIEWKAGAYLAKRLETDKLDAMDQVIIMTNSHDQLMGFAALVQEDIVEKPDYGPFLSTVYVSPDFRGQGLSLELVDRITEIARQKGVKDLYAITAHQGLYEKNGFTFQSPVHDKFGRDMRLLVKHLG